MPIIETPVVPITLLDAVNMILDSVGLAAIMSLVPADLDESAAEAIRQVGWASRSIQNKGWYFNTLDDYVFTPDVTSGEIVVPPNFSAVLRSRCTGYVKFTQRGGRLLDLKNNTFVWTQNVTAKVRQYVEFQDLPEAFRWYITAMAGKEYGKGRVPDSTKFRFSEDTLKTAREDAETWDALEGSANLAATSPHFGFMLWKG
jgi:hypothetical protein